MGVQVHSTGSQGDYEVFGSTADDEIQQAVDSVTSGGEIYLNSGVFNISKPILIRNPYTKIRGQGFSTILRLASNVNDFIFKFASFPSTGMVGNEISNMKLECNGDNQSSGGGIYGLGAIHCVFDKLWVNKPYDQGLSLYQDGSGGTGHHNKIINCLFDQGQLASGDGVAVKMEASDENFISNCDFESNGRAAATNHYAIYDMSGLQKICNCTFVGDTVSVKMQGDRTTLIGCTFDGVKQNSINLNGSLCTITGNVFFNIGYGTGSATYTGVFVDNVSGNTITSNVFISDNTGSTSGVNMANGATNNLCTSNVFKAQGSGWGTANIVVGSGNTTSGNVSI